MLHMTTKKRHPWLLAGCLLIGISSRLWWCALARQQQQHPTWNELRQRLSRSRSAAVKKEGHQDHHHHAHATCGSQDPTRRERAVQEVRTKAALQQQQRRGRHLQLESCDNLRDQKTTEIQVNLHLVTVLDGVFLHPNNAVDRFVNDDPDFDFSEFSSQADLEDLFQINIDVLNAAFADTPFTFMRERTTVTENLDWTFDLAAYQDDISQAVGSKDLRQMDVFAAYNLEERDDDLILRGLASPGALQRRGTGDGIYLAYQVLPQATLGDGLGGYEMG